jgi:hypothetical protein
MDKDMHYCVIKVLAGKAGFSAEESELIAYSSQYVDDAVENRPMHIDFEGNVPAEILACERYDRKSGCFDPTCTAYRGIRWISVIFRPDIQRKVYVSFHLIPSKPYTPPAGAHPSRGDYSYVTEMGSIFARDIVERSVRELKESGYSARKLIKLGIALHTFADTYSHYNFSGRNSCLDNNRKGIEFEDSEGGTWKKFRGGNKFESIMTPRFAHAVALGVPDFSHMRLRHATAGAMITRNNPANYLKAAEEIYRILSSIIKDRNTTGGTAAARGAADYWDTISVNINKCISAYSRIEDYSVESSEVFHEKFKRYEDTFNCALSYSEEEWRRAALDTEQYDWINYSRGNYGRARHVHIGDLKWFYFHMEAHDQRHYVLDKIRKDLK